MNLNELNSLPDVSNQYRIGIRESRQDLPGGVHYMDLKDLPAERSLVNGNDSWRVAIRSSNG